VSTEINPDEKVEIVDGVRYEYSTRWIYQLEEEEHWRLYWNQQKIAESKIEAGDRVLEIGLGTGFTANYLRGRGVRVTTLDIDAEKKPDIVGNIVSHTFEQQYDHFLAFEIFEHIPYDKFTQSLRQIRPACGQYFFLSLPIARIRKFEIEIWTRFLGRRRLLLSRRRKKIQTRHHFWEIDHGETTWENVQATFRETGFEVEQTRDAFLRRFIRLRSV